ncbi:hypothetical protein N2152v2_004892 [Parachlorella kessleri]
MDDRVDLIYFEPQIAQDLDEAEKKLMLESGMESADYLRFLAEESGNVAGKPSGVNAAVVSLDVGKLPPAMALCADHGMFSIQVLAKALDVWGLTAIPINNPEAADAKADPTREHAFICNLREHWFTIREIWGQWWNLNSIFSAPEPLSPFYLSAFLGTLQEQGYSIFVVRGQLPAEPHPDSITRDGPGRWLTPEGARMEHESSQKLKQQGFLKAAYKGVLTKASEMGNVVRLQTAGAKRAHQGEDEFEGGEDPDLARALAASLADREDHDMAAVGGSGQRGGFDGGLQGGQSNLDALHDDEDADLAAAIAASLADHGQQAQQAQQQQQQSGHAGAHQQQPDRGGPQTGAAQLTAAVAAGLQQHTQHAPPVPGGAASEPESTAAASVAPLRPAPAKGGTQPDLPQLGPEPEPGQEGTIEVGLRLPDGSRHTRRFLAEQHTVGHVAALAAAQGVDMARHRLALRFPRRVFDDLGKTLQEAGISDKEMLQLETC